MKYLWFFIGILMSIAGFLMLFGALLVTTFSRVDIPISLIVVEMIFYGLVPFVGGIALCNLTSKQWRSNIQCRMCNHRIELKSLTCPHCGEKVDPVTKAGDASASDNRFKRLCRKIFLEESPRQGEDSTMK